MKINIVDGDTILWLVTYNKKGEREKTLEECCEQLENFINNIMIATKSTHYIIYLTTGRNFRYRIDPTYKSKRPVDKPNYFKEVKQYLIDKYKAIYHSNYESDDLCLTTRKLLQEKEINCFISSPDKDIKKTFGETYDYKKLEWCNTSKLEAYEYFFRSMIVGDSGDGVNGLKGLGNAFVDKLFKGNKNFPELVLNSYINYYKKISLGIENFYLTYKLLKIVDDIPNFEIPELIEFKPLNNEKTI